MTNLSVRVSVLTDDLKWKLIHKMRIENHQQTFDVLTEDQKFKCSQVFKLIDSDNSGAVDKEGIKVSGYG